MRSVLEVCVDSTASALAAKRGGASRLELCADLIVGGTTPSLALVRQVKAETGLPVRALLRPRFGDFCYDSYELAQMEQLAAELQQRSEEMQAQLLRTPRIVGPRRMLRAYPKLRHGSKLRSLPTLREMLHRAEQENKDDNKNTK
mgnify:CR=1 FL=1